MTETDKDTISERLNRIKQKPKAKGRWRPYAIGAGAFTTGIALTAYGFLTVGNQPTQQNILNLPTSQVSDFQDGSGLDDFTISRPRSEVPQAEPQIAPSVVETETITVDNPALSTELQELRDAMADRDTALMTLQNELDQIRSDNDEKETALAAAQEERDQLLLQLSSQEDAYLSGQDSSALEQQRLMELEMRRAEEQSRRQAQILSPMVAFRASGSWAGEDEGSRDYGADRSFLRDRSEKVSVTRSQVIANPSNTLVQGTLIEATLETAISSQLEGNVAANISRDVWSMDMTQVLIPRGSKLYGRYNSDVERGQRRVAIAWDRLITPDGQSVILEGYGTDRIGRSGMPGRVNNHTAARFGSAAAVSIVGALPAVLAAAIEKERDDEIRRDTAERVGENASEAMANIMADYLDIPPTISVDQGAVVMVRINNDIELF